MDEFQSEKEQIEEIKKWWKENGTFVVTGLVIGVLLLGGIRYWKTYRLGKAEGGSVAYEQLREAVRRGDTGEASEIDEQLKREFSSTPYPVQGALSMAALYVRNNEPEQAASQLRYVLETTKDKTLSQVARLRLARVLILQDKATEALGLLDPVPAGEFAAHYHHVRGDAYTELDRPDDARREYRAALDQSAAGQLDRQFVEMKLNDLATSEPEA